MCIGDVQATTLGRHILPEAVYGSPRNILASSVPTQRPSVPPRWVFADLRPIPDTMCAALHLGIVMAWIHGGDTSVHTMQ